MRRFFIITLAIAFIFSLCAVPVSAATYDLPQPSLVYKFGSYVWQRFFYRFDEEDEMFEPVNQSYYYPKYSFKYFDFMQSPYFNSGLSFSGGSTWPSQSDVLGNVESLTGISDNYNVLLSRCWGVDLRNTIVVPTFVQSGIYLPTDGQYLQISFSVSNRNNFTSLDTGEIFNFNNLFVLYSSAGTSGERTTLSPSTVTVSKNGTYNYYNVYFDYSSFAFSGNLNTGQPLSLAIRIPFTFPNTSTYENANVLYALDFDYPRSYDILTVGGYEEALDSIQSAIFSSNQNLLDFYNAQSSEDATYVVHLTNSNNQLQGSINDYQSANVVVDNIKDVFTTPPLNDMVENSFQSIDSGFDVKSLFSLPWLVSALSLVFSFCIIRLILYGTKEG